MNRVVIHFHDSLVLHFSVPKTTTVVKRPSSLKVLFLLKGIGLTHTKRFEQKIEELQKEIEESQRKNALLSFYKEAMKSHDFNPKYRVSQKNIDSKMVVSRWFIQPNAFELPEHWKKHYENVQGSGSKIISFPNSFTCFHDEKYIFKNNDIELMLFIEKQGMESERIA